jgi:hypothetical protein
MAIGSLSYTSTPVISGMAKHRRQGPGSSPSLWAAAPVGDQSIPVRDRVGATRSLTRLSIPTSPPDCLANPKTCASPRPEPFPGSLAVKEGSYAGKHVVRNTDVGIVDGQAHIPSWNRLFRSEGRR